MIAARAAVTLSQVLDGNVCCFSRLVGRQLNVARGVCEPFAARFRELVAWGGKAHPFASLAPVDGFLRSGHEPGCNVRACVAVLKSFVRSRHSDPLHWLRRLI